MRPYLRFAGCSSLVLLVVACSSEVASSVPPPTPEPLTAPVAQPLVCAPRDPSICDALPRATPGDPSPSQSGAFVWAELTTAATAPGRGGGNPRLALSDDGTLQRTRIERTFLDALETAPGLVLATVSASSLAVLHADVTAVAASDLQGYFGPSETSGPNGSLTNVRLATADVLRIGLGTACLHSSGDARSSCAPGTVTKLRDDLGLLAQAVEVKWRAQQAGTVSIGIPDEVTVLGPWPLDESLAVAGSATLTRQEWARFAGVGLYSLSDGVTFVSVSDIGRTPDGDESVYCERMSAVVVGDDLAAVRDQLIANQGRYTTSGGAWLGIPLGTDQFPAFKDHDYAILPATADAPQSMRTLNAIEQLDLRGQGEVSLP